MREINLYAEIAALIDAINAAKNANRYADANVLFAAALAKIAAVRTTKDNDAFNRAFAGAAL